MRQLALFLVLACLVPAAALALGSKISEKDQTFLNGAMQANLGEIALARLARRKTHDPTTLAFAARMIHDHTANVGMLRRVAAALDTHLPQGPDMQAQSAMRRLVGLSRRAFDRAYLADEVRMHRDLLTDYQAELRQSANRTIDAYVRTTIPVIRTHLRLAEADLAHL